MFSAYGKGCYFSCDINKTVLWFLTWYSEREFPFSYYGYHNAEDVEYKTGVGMLSRNDCNQETGRKYWLQFRQRYCNLTQPRFSSKQAK